MLPASDLYKSVIHGPHHRIAYVDSYTIDGAALALDVPITTGSVGANLTNRVTRTATVTVADQWFPRTPESAFSPYHAVVRVRAGVRYGDGTEETWPLIVGRVWSVARSAGGSVTFGVDDLAADVVAARFEAPERSRNAGSVFIGVPRYISGTGEQPAPASILAEIRRLISGAVPQAVFGVDGVTDAPVPPLVWDEDRGQALDDLAAAVGGRWYALGDGSFVVRAFDYQQDTVAQQFLDGPGGLMLSADVTQTRDGTANSVVVVAERMDGSEPVRRIVRDVSTTSPTRYGGPYGRLVQVHKVQTPLTVDQAQTLAQTQLAASTALVEQWGAEVVPDYSMEPGDLARLSYRGYSTDQVIDSISYPLVTGTSMRLATRSRGVLSTASE